MSEDRRNGQAGGSACSPRPARCAASYIPPWLEGGTMPFMRM